MDFIDQIRDLSIRIQKQAAGIQTEEATKTAFVMPSINALGYRHIVARSIGNLYKIDSIYRCLIVRLR